jgi:hypothetical protein
MELIIEDFIKSGYIKQKLFHQLEFELINNFTLLWVSTVLQLPSRLVDFSTYHLWQKKFEIDHEKMLNAQSRHIVPQGDVYNAIFRNELLLDFFSALGLVVEPWDEGLGPLAFRLIRPYPNCDGYGLSKKLWGPGGSLYSVYIPISQIDRHTGIGLVSGSHNLEFPTVKILDKFCRDELRLDLNKSGPIKIIREHLDPGEAIVFHPNLLHCEEPATVGKSSRLSLEARFIVKKL